jgi:hypothetical protein
MLDLLVSSGEAKAAAALELERAIEDKAFELRLPDGADDQGETMYVEMSPLGRAHVIVALRGLPDGKPAPPILHATRAIRKHFERAFGLTQSGQRVSDKQACIDLITSLRKGPRMAKEEVRTKAKKDIPNITDKEFDTAWRAAAGDWAAPGRPKKPLH